MTELQDHQAAITAVVATGQTILREFQSRELLSDELQLELTGVISMWEELQEAVYSIHDELVTESSGLNKFLGDLCDFCEELNDFYVEFYDEYCTAIPPRASQETVARHRQNLEVTKLLLW